MFIEAALAVAAQVTDPQLKQGLLYPLQANILETEIKTAARVAQLIFDSNLAGVSREEDCEQFIRRHVYNPSYLQFIETIELESYLIDSHQGIINSALLSQKKLLLLQDLHHDFPCYILER